MKSKIISKSTANRSEFNRAYKFYLEHSGQLRCSWCKYNRGENDTRKCYGGFEEKSIRHPNWKLVSKKPKQWMKKPIKIIKSPGWHGNKTYVEIKFSA